MTKHTDTSRSGDLVKLKAMLAKCNDSGHDWWSFTLAAERDVPVLIDRIEALEAENERLREALGLADAALRGANMNMNVVERKVRAALGETE